MGFDVGAHLVRVGIVLPTSDHASVVSINIFVALLCSCIVIGHLLEENRWMNESITALIIGLCTGVVILLTTKGKSSHLLVFSKDLFFIYLLPPIIFNAGSQAHRITQSLKGLNVLRKLFNILISELIKTRSDMIFLLFVIICLSPGLKNLHLLVL